MQQWVGTAWETSAQERLGSWTVTDRQPQEAFQPQQGAAPPGSARIAFWAVLVSLVYDSIPLPFSPAQDRDFQLGSNPSLVTCGLGDLGQVTQPWASVSFGR